MKTFNTFETINITHNSIPIIIGKNYNNVPCDGTTATSSDEWKSIGLIKTLKTNNRNYSISPTGAR